MIKNEHRDYSISFARLMAMLFIITCHIQQYYNIELCWWFNVGVQMFFFISGYLYSNKTIDNSGQFIFKQFIKILVPYYVLIVIVGGISYFINPGFGLKQLFHLVIVNGSGGFSSFNHLWFISYILICYLMTPSLLHIKIISNNLVKSIIRSGLLLIGLLLFFELFVDYYISAWIICYVLGIIFGQCKTMYTQKIINIMQMCIIMLALITNSIKIYCMYIANTSFLGFSKFSNYSHVLLGIAITICLMKIYDSWLKGKCIKVLNLSDKYSYYVYLTHQVFLLGDYSLLRLIDNPVVAVGLSLLSTVIASFILSYCSRLLNPKVLNLTNWIAKE